MTTGHKHRTIRVKHYYWWVRLLRRPLWHCRDKKRVESSPYPYGPCALSIEPVTCWTLSALGILHRWTRLTLDVEYDDDCKRCGRGRPAA